MFEHERFEVLAFEAIPQGCDLIIMDEMWMEEIEREFVRFFSGDRMAEPNHVGYVCAVSLKRVFDDGAMLAWYPVFNLRYHEIPIVLPRKAFVICVEAKDCDDKPRLFVRSSWLKELYASPLAAFAWIDAIGVKKRLIDGSLDPFLLLRLRERVDEVSSRYPALGFASFADNLLVKQVWTIGCVDSDIPYTYAPEELFPVIELLRGAFKDDLGLDSYAILTQGLNAYSNSRAMHASPCGNHVSFNTLGTPFAQLIAIDSAVKSAIRAGRHAPAELYMDRTVFRSLNLNFSFEKDVVPLHTYDEPMTGRGHGEYIATDFLTITSNFR